MTLVTAQKFLVCFSCKIHRWLKTAMSDSSGYLDALLEDNLNPFHCKS